MPESIARLIVGAAGAYAAAGAVFGLLFVTRGVSRIDASARGAGWGFRLLILPGAIALWPYLLRRWRSGATGPPEERNAHRAAAREAR